MKPVAPTPAGDSTSSRGASGIASHGRFLPGAVLLERYRIIGLLGRGGMGEVYRADDLKLGQPVALKFLPRMIGDVESRLQRFFNEVRTARQVTHPNVCRVYDLGELEGEHFLSMEYVDGEDLASLLRRIGRLPQEKAVQIARQLCAGLAAAHDQGILHRDLKPANVMLDGRGRARITDFGLAGLAVEIEGEEVRSGTPAYMAPEQLRGEAVSTRSDLYALGLVLYELFTGRTAFQADSVEELRRKQQETTPSSPSSIVEGLDPGVERVILRCLDPDPARRPGSALTVAAALPGGDPLAAALAAGETPSPEMVAAAGDAGGLAPSVAVGFLAVLIAGIVGVLLMAPHAKIFSWVPLDRSPEVLADRAREIALQLGPDEPPEDTAIGIWFNDDFYEHLGNQDRPDRWEAMRAGRPPVLGVWYRASPRPMYPELDRGQVTRTEPPMSLSGMVLVEVDSLGRLWRFRAVPPERSGPSTGPAEPDWAPLFAAAGLDLATFTEVEPEFAPFDYADRRAAWTGPAPENPEITLRVEAGAFGGRPASFRVVEPWSRTDRQASGENAARRRWTVLVFGTVFLTLMTAILFFFRRNLLLGRGDRKGAFRLALYVAPAQMLMWLAGSHHQADVEGELVVFINFLLSSVGAGCCAWIIYVALEPYARRLWPDTLIGWNRLLQGRFRDPMVGRDLLVGGTFGILATVAFIAHFFVPGWAGMLPHAPDIFRPEPMMGAGPLLARLLAYTMAAVFPSLITLFGLQLAWVILRRKWLAVAAFFVIAVFADGIDFDHFWIDAALHMVVRGLSLFVLLRYGLLALMAFWYFETAGVGLLHTIDFSVWYGRPALVASLLLLAIAGYGFYIALAGRPIFADRLMEEGAPAGVRARS